MTDDTADTINNQVEIRAMRTAAVLVAAKAWTHAFADCGRDPQSLALFDRLRSAERDLLAAVERA